MRVYLLILAALPLVAQTDTNMACVERVEIPAYPPLAKAARIAGAITASLAVGPNGSAQSVTLTTEPGTRPNPILRPSVEKSVGASSFGKACAGKTVTLVFHFELGEKLTDSPQPIVSFGYPNHFWITAPPMLVQP
jgi:hypothetical protein